MQLAWPRPTRSTIALLATLCAAWLASVLVAPLRETLIPRDLAITADTLGQLKLWGLLTHALWTRSFVDLLFQGMILYLFGAELGHVWSPKKWWGTLLAATLTGGLLAALTALVITPPQPYIGMGAATNALFAAYCWRHWDRSLHILAMEIKGKALFGFFLGLDLLFALLSADPAMLLARLAGAGVGLLSAMNLGTLQDMRLRYHSWRVRRNLKIVARNPEADPARDRRKTRDGDWIN